MREEPVDQFAVRTAPLDTVTIADQHHTLPHRPSPGTPDLSVTPPVRTDTARAYANWGRREECVSALLAAEREAPEERHARPAVRDLVSSLLVTGRT